MRKMLIPAVRGKVNNETYYTGVMSFCEIAELATSRHSTDKPLNAERDCNSIVIGVSGPCDWLEIEFNGEQDKDIHNAGLLRFEKSAVLSLLSGASRVTEILEAIRKDPERRRETYPVVFVSGDAKSPSVVLEI